MSEEPGWRARVLQPLGTAPPTPKIAASPGTLQPKGGCSLSPLPATSQRQLNWDEIILSFEKICDEFDSESSWSSPPGDPGNSPLLHGHPLESVHPEAPSVACNFHATATSSASTETEKSTSLVQLYVNKSESSNQDKVEPYVSLLSSKSPLNLEGDDEKEVEKIRNILARLDFSKYRRGAVISRRKFSMESSPKCYTSTNSMQTTSISSRSLNLDVEKETSEQEKRQNNVIRSSSFSQVEKTLSSSEFCHTSKSQVELPTCSTVTLPSNSSQHKMEALISVPQTVISQIPLQVGKYLSHSELSIDSAVESVTDEGFVAETDPLPTATYASCTIIPETSFTNINVTIKATVNTSQALSVPLCNPKPYPIPASEKRKRRKGLSAPATGLQVPIHEQTKTGNGRSLTFPPQRKTSISEEELEYTSVDSNGMRSLLFAPNLVNVSGQEGPRQSSDLSLADSHYCPSEMLGEETYRDVVESVTTDLQKLSVEERNGKMFKKKHYSDPGSDKNTGESVDFPELMSASFRSEPELKNKKGNSFVETTNENNISLSSNVELTNKVNVTTNLERTSSDIDERTKYQDLEEKSKSPNQQRRYFKKRLRGPYGEMLEEEMRKHGEKPKPSFSEELSFLQELTESKQVSDATSSSESVARPSLFPTSQSLDDSQLHSSNQELNSLPKRKISANFPLGSVESEQLASPEMFLEANSSKWCTSFQKATSSKKTKDTRTHIVGELFETERSYVESLQTLVNKYMRSLKSGGDNAGLVEPTLVDEMFAHIPEILSHHEAFLEALRPRLLAWDDNQKIGDIFVASFAHKPVIDVYTAFINNWKNATEAIKLATQNRPAFAKFLEQLSREHKGKLTLDALLIMPVQRIPRYVLLLKDLLKHTSPDHPDHQLLLVALKEVHELANHINSLEAAGPQLSVRDVEHLIEGCSALDLVQPERTFLCHDLVTIPGSLGVKKERGLFLFSDLLLITSIKRRGGANRKISTATSPCVAGPLELNKYRLLLRFPLDNLNINKGSEGSFKKLMKEIEALEEDVAVLSHIADLASNLNCNHQVLDDSLRDLLNSLNRQIQEKKNPESHLRALEISITLQESVETLTIIFPSSERKIAWEGIFNAAKQKLALNTDRRSAPEFLNPLPIRKTRAGLQFTCASPTPNQQDVWVCNSDGYVGQVCVLRLAPGESTVTSCNAVANSRILCVAAVPATSTLQCPNVGQAGPRFGGSLRKRRHKDGASGVNVTLELVEDTQETNFQIDSESSDEEEESKSQDDSEGSPQEEDQPTMWLGTEDGSIHIYNCNDNIRLKKHIARLQLPASVNCIAYLDAKVFAALESGDLAVFKKSQSGWGDYNMMPLSSGPVSRLLPVTGKLWCGCLNLIKVINTTNLLVESEVVVSSEAGRNVVCMAGSGLSVWVAMHASAVIKLFHALSKDCLLELNVTPAVSKMLSGCDDIIRQHKSACLRVTALLPCKDLLWVGTSAGVILTLPLPALAPSGPFRPIDPPPILQGIPHGHTGHVRFLTCVEVEAGLGNRRTSCTASTLGRMLVLSGGDGYEDFGGGGAADAAAGRDDSTNHLLLWQF